MDGLQVFMVSLVARGNHVDKTAHILMIGLVNLLQAFQIVEWIMLFDDAVFSVKIKVDFLHKIVFDACLLLP